MPIYRMPGIAVGTGRIIFGSGSYGGRTGSGAFTGSLTESGSTESFVNSGGSDQIWHSSQSLQRMPLIIERDPEDFGSIQFRVPSYFHGGTHDRIAFYISSSGHIGIGTKNPQTAFDVRDNTQDVRASGSAANDGGGNPGKTAIFQVASSTAGPRIDLPLTASGGVSASGNIEGIIDGGSF